MEQYRESAEEIRLRYGCRPSLIAGGRETAFSDCIINEKHLLYVLDVATGASLHSSAEYISSGFINYRGVRVGICGQAVYKDSHLCGFKKYTSLSIRIPRKIKGLVPQNIKEKLYLENKNVLISAPPGIGKTTALRELVHYLSCCGRRIALLDERGEFAEDIENENLGRCTDVLSFVPKLNAAIHMLRSMNPQIIAMDEITKPEDIEAVFEIHGCGVGIIATVHASGLADLNNRPLYKRMMDCAVFEQILSISMDNGKRKYVLERIGL